MAKLIIIHAILLLSLAAAQVATAGDAKSVVSAGGSVSSTKNVTVYGNRSTLSGHKSSAYNSNVVITKRLRCEVSAASKPKCQKGMP
jgi:hypothetical protein